MLQQYWKLLRNWLPWYLQDYSSFSIQLQKQLLHQSCQPNSSAAIVQLRNRTETLCKTSGLVCCPSLPSGCFKTYQVHGWSWAWQATLPTNLCSLHQPQWNSSVTQSLAVSLCLHPSDKTINSTSIIGHYTNKVTEIKHCCRINFFWFWYSMPWLLFLT